jgi:hypothetical protein
MESVAQVLGQVGVAVLAVGLFFLALAFISRAWLGRVPSDASWGEAAKRNPYEASFLFFWRLRKKAAVAVGIGSVLAGAAALYWAITGT